MSETGKNLPKRFNYREREDEIYKLWEESGYFNPEKCVEDNICAEDAKVFSMILPPPNVTGTLHVGHAYMLTVEDIMIRYARMRQKRTLWIPGTDHAAIATQAKVEKELYKKEKKTRHDLGRGDFLKKVEEFAQESHDTIIQQTKKMGASLDWSREAYTLDEKRELAVRTAFKRMYDAGLIYKGERIVNWDPKMQTTVSDDEVEYVEENSPLYYIKYGPFTVATVRPETIFGDTGIAVNPNDKRYKKYIGKEVEVDLLIEKRKLKVIGDEYVDPEFGTGALKVTPAHDHNDFEMWMRHKDEISGPFQVIDEYGKMNENSGKYTGLKAKEARSAVAEDLKKAGLLEDIDEKYTNKKATNSRGGGVIEPIIKMQWFVDVNKEFTLPHSNIDNIEKGEKTTLKKIMQTVVRSGQINIVPKRFEKTYFHWIDNLRDWCISRQIWYGHRMPVWYKDGEVYVDIEPPKGDGWEQDSDTLDTWFSSGLWTFSTLGWPENTDDLKIYHPTTVLETGHDILFFWVARMVLMTGFLLGDIPFKTVYLHGLIRDEKNRKMSKSLGNAINPLDVIKEYGADALRMGLTVSATPGRDIPISMERIKGYRNFSTKLWNVTRFILMNTDAYSPDEEHVLEESDEKIREEFYSVVKSVTQYMEKMKYSQAAEEIYHYAWHTFADNVIEDSKEILYGEDEAKKAARMHVLISVWADVLKLIHPFMPYITEELYGHLPLKDKKLLMVEKWPIQ